MLVKKIRVFWAIIFFAMQACDAKQSNSNEHRAAKGKQLAQRVVNAASSEDPDYEVEALFNRSCVSCHLSGVAGAPRRGDAIEWQRRIKAKGIQQMVMNVRQGFGTMPPMGMCNQCQDRDFIALIEWMAASASNSAK